MTGLQFETAPRLGFLIFFSLLILFLSLCTPSPSLSSHCSVISFSLTALNIVYIPAAATFVSELCTLTSDLSKKCSQSYPHEPRFLTFFLSSFDVKSLLPIAWIITLEILDSFFPWHSTEKPFPYLVGSTLKIYSEANHFLALVWSLSKSPLPVTWVITVVSSLITTVSLLPSCSLLNIIVILKK